MNNEKSQREKLEQLIRGLEEKLVQGGTAAQEAERQKVRAYKDLQYKLRLQREREKKLIEEKVAHEEERLMVERNY